MIKPVILSGGSGTRLWPLSRAAKPKQFLRLVGDTSMLQQTVARVADNDAFDLPLIVASVRHEAEIARQLAAVDHDGVILEPVARNTAPAVALAALRVAPETTLLVMSSDHVMHDAEGFRNIVKKALPAVDDGYLVTFGVTPDRPETGYGYIRMGDAVTGVVRQVARFVEKPDIEAAGRFLATGDYCWNAGIFLFRADDYLSELGKHAPEILAACKAAVERGKGEGRVFRADEKTFSAAPSISIDYAVMEKAVRIAVVPLDVGWSDIGSWDSLYEMSGKDLDGNSVDSNALQIDSSGCLVRSDGPLVVTVGVEDLIVLAAEGEVLVMRRGDSQRVKEVVAALKGREAGKGVE